MVVPTVCTHKVLDSLYPQDYLWVQMNERRTVSMKLRLTPTEGASLLSLADKAGKNVSEYARERMLSVPTTIVPTEKAVPTKQVVGTNDPRLAQSKRRWLKAEEALLDLEDELKGKAASRYILPDHPDYENAEVAEAVIWMRDVYQNKTHPKKPK